MRRFSACSALLIGLCLAAPALASPANHSPLIVDVPASARVAGRAPVLSAEGILTRAAALPSHVQLVPRRVFHSGSTRVYRFDQQFEGLPVVGRGAALVADASGQAHFGTLKIENRLPASVVPAVSADTAASIAAQRARVSANASHARLVLWPTPSGARLAWSVLPPSLLPLPFVPLIVVDAADGHILSFQNLVRYKNLAKSFEFNPVSTPDPIDVTLPIDDPSTTPQNALVESYNCVDTHETKTISVYGMPFTVHVCAMQQNAIADATTGDYTQYVYESDTAGDDPFSEVSIYYHTNKAYDFFKTFDPSFELGADSKPLFVVANLMVPAGLMAGDLSKIGDPNLPFDPFPNAFSSGWDPTYGPIMSTLWPEITGAALMFGQGEKIDFAYDGDVVYHEFTHSVVGATLQLVGTWHLDSQGATVAPGAMNEGLADYFSSAITGDPASGEYAGKEFGDDAIRHLDNSYACPSHLAGEVHFDSQFWSAALWATRASLPSDAERHSFDEAIFTAMASGPSGDLSYEEVSQLFVSAVQASSLGAAVAQQLESAFEQRGALPSCTRTIEWTGTPLKSNEPGLYGHFIAGGKASFATTLSYAPGLLQVHVPLSPNDIKLRMSFAQLVSGSANPLPTGNTPYAPAFLVSFGQPISFDLSNGVSANTDTTVTATKSATAFSGEIDIPADTTDAYVMVINTGEDDGYYTNLAFDVVADVPQDAGVDAEPDAPEVDAAAPPQSSAAPSDDSGGCGCAVPSRSHNGEGALALLAAALGAIIARRRKADKMTS